MSLRPQERHFIFAESWFIPPSKRPDITIDWLTDILASTETNKKHKKVNVLRIMFERKYQVECIYIKPASLKYIG